MSGRWATFRFSETIVIFIGPMFVNRISESKFLIDTASVIGSNQCPSYRLLRVDVSLQISPTIFQNLCIKVPFWEHILVLKN